MKEYQYTIFADVSVGKRYDFSLDRELSTDEIDTLSSGDVYNLLCEITEGNFDDKYIYDSESLNEVEEILCDGKKITKY